MFLRANHREKDGKRYTYWSLVDIVRTLEGPRQRTRQRAVDAAHHVGPRMRWQPIEVGHVLGAHLVFCLKQDPRAASRRVTT